MPILIASPLVVLAALAKLLDDTEVGILRFRPVYAPHGPTTILDLAYLRLNPTARACCGCPSSRRPATFRALYPKTEVDFVFYRDTFLAGTM